jgi:hypothetical protein
MTTATPITTEIILQEDGADVALADFQSQVRAGEAAIRRILAGAEPGTSWTLRELREEAAEGRRDTAMGAALMSLDRLGELSIDFARSTVVALG